jgi:hypothetical protein
MTPRAAHCSPDLREVQEHVRKAGFVAHARVVADADRREPVETGVPVPRFLSRRRITLADETSAGTR